ncbi:hypothetical protein BC628DRAFT_197047 [Trametes gibbosa]|nr:hypothetical protein BC628DRAFT_197047 [Trametes gibbosa]
MILRGDGTFRCVCLSEGLKCHGSKSDGSQGGKPIFCRIGMLLSRALPHGASRSGHGGRLRARRASGCQSRGERGEFTVVHRMKDCAVARKYGEQGRGSKVCVVNRNNALRRAVRRSGRAVVPPGANKAKQVPRPARRWIPPLAPRLSHPARHWPSSPARCPSPSASASAPHPIQFDFCSSVCVLCSTGAQ